MWRHFRSLIMNKGRKGPAQARKFNQTPKNKSRNHCTSKGKTWPSKEHKCVSFEHDDVLTVEQMSDIVKKFGTVEKIRTIPLSKRLRSTFQMSSANEAEHAWKGVLSNMPIGLYNANPERDRTIESFSKYWDDELVTEGLKNGLLKSGVIRINPKIFHNAYISDEDNPDILIDSITARNRALNGDLVAIKIRHPEFWVVDENSDLKSADGSDRKIKTADVVAILEKRNSRVCGGVLVEKRRNKVLFRPVNSTVPRLLIPIEECPKDFEKQPKNYENKLFLASIGDWGENDIFVEGNLSQYIGNRGEIDTETKRILLENDVDDSDFPDSVLEELESLPTDGHLDRKDLRTECIFTIDPATAKDLDDALHCKQISDNIFEVGVHIADVSYYVQQDTEIDKIAAKRCTSVYLVQKVIPMLPAALCERLCSLNPGQDKLTYSVIWNMTGEGKILDTWCGRTVIRSCSKLTYDNAQSFISDPEGELQPDCFPAIFGGFDLTTIRIKVLQLHTIAQLLRKDRHDNGALRLDQIKLAFTLDHQTGMPNSCYPYQYQSSNELVEEFMLLANMSVAEILNEKLPSHAFLRRHPSPKLDMLQKSAAYCGKHGWNLDISSSSNLSKSLRAAATSDTLPENTIYGLLHFAAKPQELALYFCAGSLDDQEKYRHFALNVPLYTHFTSPIRRYADVIVHRQLALIQQNASHQMNLTSPEDLQNQANLCNTKKAQSKKVQDLSVQLFFYSMVKSLGSLEDQALVLQVADHSFDILPLRYGEVCRVYLDNLPLVGFKYMKHLSEMELLWPCNGDDKYKLTDEEIRLAKSGKLVLPKYSSTSEQMISVFSTVSVILEASENEVKLKAYLKKPTVNSQQ